MAAPFYYLSFFPVFSFFLSHFPLPSTSNPFPQCLVYPSGCSDVLFLRFPFTYSSDPKCGLYKVECSGSKNQFEIGGRRYTLKAIFAEDSLIMFQDEEIAGLSKSCSHLRNLTLSNSHFVSFELESPNYTIMKCNRSQENILKNYSHIYNFTGCDDSVLYYWLEEPQNSIRNLLLGNCSLFTYPLDDRQVGLNGGTNLPTLLSAVFLVKWHLTAQCVDCHFSKKGICSWNPAPGEFICSQTGADERSDNKSKVIIGISLGTSVAVVILLVCVFLILFFRDDIHNAKFFWTKDHKDDRAVEKFLKKHGSVVAKRYDYSDLKKRTNSYKDKLGQGGFGGVFKGKLQDGRLIAVKVLSNSKCNGEEFVNEVATIGRTNHVNIVTLLGFSSNRSKRALIYEFMPNGSLEQFIYGKRRKANPLGWEKINDIAVGIARGLEYLHRGCSTRIVHLDIKPHNILLDEDFLPKISDFGLAKICPPKESIISMVGARGTVGYIAPEVYCRNFGGVSHKSDVYSYGMMVLEMVGGRSNIEATAENTSEIYFPDWIYKRIELNECLGLNEIATREEESIARKMIIVGLWCIQVDPAVRPTTSRVVEMLEASLESLPVPPRPFLSSSSRVRQLQTPIST